MSDEEGFHNKKEKLLMETDLDAAMMDNLIGNIPMGTGLDGLYTAEALEDPSGVLEPSQADMHQDTMYDPFADGGGYQDQFPMDGGGGGAGGGGQYGGGGGGGGGQYGGGGGQYGAGGMVGDMIPAVPQYGGGGGGGALDRRGTLHAMGVRNNNNNVGEAVNYAERAEATRDPYDSGASYDPTRAERLRGGAGPGQRWAEEGSEYTAGGAYSSGAWSTGQSNDAGNRNRNNASNRRNNVGNHNNNSNTSNRDNNVSTYGNKNAGNRRNNTRGNHSNGDVGNSNNNNNVDKPRNHGNNRNNNAPNEGPGGLVRKETLRHKNTSLLIPESVHSPMPSSDDSRMLTSAPSRHRAKSITSPDENESEEEIPTGDTARAAALKEIARHNKNRDGFLRTSTNLMSPESIRNLTSNQSTLQKRRRSVAEDHQRSVLDNLQKRNTSKSMYNAAPPEMTHRSSALSKRPTVKQGGSTLANIKKSLTFNEFDSIRRKSTFKPSLTVTICVNHL